MPAPLLIPAAVGLARFMIQRAAPYAARGLNNVGKQWVKAATGKTAPGMFGKKAARFSGSAVAAGGAQEALEDYLGIDIPEITPNSTLGSEIYKNGKTAYVNAQEGLANYLER